VGIAAIQLAKRAGARVLATASSDDKLARLGELVLDEGINYVRDDFVAESRRLTDGRGVDVIVDSVGGATLQGSIRGAGLPGPVRDGRGRRADAGRAPRHLDHAPNNQTLSGYFLGVELLVSPRPHVLIAACSTTSRGGAPRGHRPGISLSEAGAAHAYIESRQSFGRVLLAP